MSDTLEEDRALWKKSEGEYAEANKALEAENHRRRKHGRYWRHLTWLYRERLKCEEIVSAELKSDNDTLCEDNETVLDKAAEQAKTIERLTEGIKGALQQAGNRWDEWGTRALSVADILDAALKETP